MIEERVLGQPGAPAICSWDGHLSYRELDQLASRLTGQLVELGVKPDVLVPLCFEKSMWTPVAMLGVLKAGGGFVLLDPGLPEQRLQTIVDQLDAGFILSSAANLGLCSRLSNKVIKVDPESLEDLQRLSCSTQKVRPLPSNSMFAVFTSGSTGTPKGVMLSHCNFSSELKHQLEPLDFERDSRVFDFASYAFDVAVHNVMATLVSGGCICIPAEHERRDCIGQAMARTRATIADLTPSVARLIYPASVPELKTLILAGEAVVVDDVLRWWGKTRVVNAYGPAECNISTVNGAPSSPDEAVRIGKGAGLVTWVVDPANHDVLLPPGHTGELLLEGPLVGRGYLDDAEKTAEAFVEDPAWLVQGPPSPDQPGRRGRLYKTGDLLRYNEDGSLTFVGQKDAQVKIRGQRVELSEVEHWVQRCTGPRHVVAEVISLRGGGSSPTLAAFLQAENEPRDAAIRVVSIVAEARDKLAGNLPSYMIPAVFLSVCRIPMTPTGKTDRRRIREMGSSLSLDRLAANEQGAMKREPGSHAERQIQKIWAKVLGIEPGSIGADGFVQLGGNSISAMAAVGEARKLGLQMTVADIFRHPRLHQLAERATPVHAASDTVSRCQLGDHVEQSFSQEQLWLLERLLPGLSWALMPWAVRLRGPLQLDSLGAAFEALRTTFGTRNGANMQFVGPAKPKRLNVVDVPSADEGALDALLERDRTAPLDLETGPAWRASVYRLGTEEHVLSVVLHHIVADGWGLDVLRRELAAFYSAAVRGHDPLKQADCPLIRYRDYSAWQRQPSQMAVQQRQLDYWVGQLEASCPAEFAGDRPRPAALSGQTDAREIRVEGMLHQHLQSFCRERQVTPFVVLLAAFRATHACLSGLADATIGTPSANRDRWETRDVVGPFVNVQCIRVRMDRDSTSFEHLVGQVHAATIASFANQDVPFERIVSRLHADADPSRHPLVQTVFAFHSRLDVGAFTLEGVETELLAMPVASKFDVEFHLY